MRRLIRHNTLAIFLMLVVTSCDYRDLNFVYEERCGIWVDVDWSEFVQESPTGMSVYCFPRGSSDGPYVFKSNHIDGVMVLLPLGEYDIMVFNQGVDEFGSFHFSGMDNYSTATVVLEKKETNMLENTINNELVYYEPEWLAVATKEGVSVTQEKIDRSIRLRMASSKVNNSYENEVVAAETIYLSPKNIVYTANVNIRVHGINNIRSARANISGMAGSIVLSTGMPNSFAVSHRLENWDISYDSEDYSRGYMSTSYVCFGLPSESEHIHSKGAETCDSSILKISYYLVDDETQCDFSYDISDKIICNNKSLTLSLDIGDESYPAQEPTEDGDSKRPELIPDVNPSGGVGGAFQPDFEDWDENQTIDIPVG